MKKCVVCRWELEIDGKDNGGWGRASWVTVCIGAVFEEEFGSLFAFVSKCPIDWFSIDGDFLYITTFF
jgi:hypothetical protein